MNAENETYAPFVLQEFLFLLLLVVLNFKIRIVARLLQKVLFVFWEGKGKAENHQNILANVLCLAEATLAFASLSAFNSRWMLPDPLAVMEKSKLVLSCRFSFHPIVNTF